MVMVMSVLALCRAKQGAAAPFRKISDRLNQSARSFGNKGGVIAARRAAAFPYFGLDRCRPDRRFSKFTPWLRSRMVEQGHSVPHALVAPKPSRSFQLSADPNFQGLSLPVHGPNSQECRETFAKAYGAADPFALVSIVPLTTAFLIATGLRPASRKTASTSGPSVFRLARPESRSGPISSKPNPKDQDHVSHLRKSLPARLYRRHP